MNRRHIFNLSGLIALLAIVLVLLKHWYPAFGLGVITGIVVNYFLIELILVFSGFPKSSKRHTPYEPED